jgi:hypothetical protein
MIQFSLPCNTVGRDSVLYSCILVFLKVYCGINLLFIMPVIFKKLSNLSTSFSYDIKFHKQLKEFTCSTLFLSYNCTFNRLSSF